MNRLSFHLLDLSISDLSQQYAQSCFNEENLQTIVSQQCRSVDDVVREAQLIPAMHECQRRELLYRMLRLLYNSSLSGSPYITVSDFDQMIDISRLSWCQAEDCIEHHILIPHCVS